MSPVILGYTPVELVIWSTIIIVGYAIIARGLFRATDGTRFYLIDVACPLLESDGVSDEQKQIIKRALNSVHSARSAWTLVLSLIILIVCVPFGGIPVKDDTVPPALEVNYETLKSRWVLATLGNSAGATFIFFGLVILLFVFTTSLHHIATLLMYRRMGKGRWLPA